MKQQLAIITLGVKDLSRSKYFYVQGFGWTPIHENNDTIFYQMNGFVLSTWLQSALEEDMQRPCLENNAGITLAHNVASKEEVKVVLHKLATTGGRILRDAEAPPHGGLRGYIADPDNHAWEIMWNPIWKTNEQGWVTLML